MYRLRKKAAATPNPTCIYDPQNQLKWLSNFVIDSYLECVKNETTGVEVFTWEGFKRGIGKKGRGTDSKKNREAVRAIYGIFPCNDRHSEHWFLGVVLPKEKTIFTLDSLPNAFPKPTAMRQVEKMMALLQKVDVAVLKDQWSFNTNKPCDIPQQVNLTVVSLLVKMFGCQMHHGNTFPHFCLQEIHDP